MLPPGRLGFALRKLIFDLMAVEIDPSIPSAQVANQFEIALADFDVAMSDRPALNAVLTFAEAASPDPATQTAIDQVQSDIELPPSP